MNIPKTEMPVYGNLNYKRIIVHVATTVHKLYTGLKPNLKNFLM